MASDLADRETEAEPRKRGLAPSLAIAALVVLVDQLTKHWAVNRLSGDQVIHLIWTLQLNLAFNSGMAFSTGQGLGPLIAVVATLVIAWLLISLRNPASALSVVGVGFVIGGAAGNLCDRLFRGDGILDGSVVDFIDLQWFPIFNVADIAVNVGALLIIVDAVRTARKAPA